MATLVKKLRSGGVVEFSRGSFDDWCVYLTFSLHSCRFPPTDVQYFSRLQKLGNYYYGRDTLYRDFLMVYDRTTSAIDPSVLKLIEKITEKYHRHTIEMEGWLTVIYAGMIAEENKAYAKLKKRIKRLGMHQILVENIAPVAAANFSKGKKWRELDSIMKEKGF